MRQRGAGAGGRDEGLDARRKGPDRTRTRGVDGRRTRTRGQQDMLGTRGRPAKVELDAAWLEWTSITRHLACLVQTAGFEPRTLRTERSTVTTALLTPGRVACTCGGGGGAMLLTHAHTQLTNKRATHTHTRARTHTQTHTHAHTQIMQARAHSHSHTRTHAPTHKHTHARTNTHCALAAPAPS